MLSRENRILLAFAVLGLALFVGLSTFTELSTTLLIAILVLVGVVVPQAILGRMTSGEN